MAFDHTTGELFWTCCCTYASTHIYYLNPETGVASLVGDVAGMPQVELTGLFCVQPTVGIDDIQHSSPITQIYPNPATESITLSGIEPGTEVNIYDMTGRRVMNFKASEGTTIDISHLASGTYMVATPTGNTKFVKK